MARVKDIYEKLAKSPIGSAVRTGTESELAVFIICKNLGYDIKMADNCCDFVVNGHNVEVKGRKISDKTRAYSFDFWITQRAVADFFVFHAINKNDFYVIPKKKIKRKYWSVCIPREKEVHQWTPYKNNWELLKRDEKEEYVLDYII